MAGDWIKIEHTTPDKPEVIMMARMLRIDRDMVAGKLQRIWIWADQNSVSGSALTINEEFLDSLVRKKGFAMAMRAAGWLVGGNGTLISFPNFERHNGKPAKARAMTNRRVAEFRGRGNDPETPPQPLGNDDVTLLPLEKALPEKSNLEKSNPPIVPPKAGDEEKLQLEGGSEGATPKRDPVLDRARALFRIHAGTPLDRMQKRAWEKGKETVRATREADWRLLEWWYRFNGTEAKYRRKDLAQALNNWGGEISRARAVAEGLGLDFEKKKNGSGLVPDVDYPENWRDYLDPDINAPKRFEELPESGRTMVIGKWKSK
jgi:hypothetical protein